MVHIVFVTALLFFASASLGEADGEEPGQVEEPEQVDVSVEGGDRPAAAEGENAKSGDGSDWQAMFSPPKNEGPVVDEGVGSTQLRRDEEAEAGAGPAADDEAEAGAFQEVVASGTGAADAESSESFSDDDLAEVEEVPADAGPEEEGWKEEAGRRLWWHRLLSGSRRRRSGPTSSWPTPSPHTPYPVRSSRSRSRSRSRARRGRSCFDPATEVLLGARGGRAAAIADVGLGDVLYVGGRVTGVQRFAAGNGDMYVYKGVNVTGAHTVYDEEAGKFVKVADAVGAVGPSFGAPVVVDLSTENHRIVAKGKDGVPVLFTDYEEIGFSEEIEQIELAELNAEADPWVGVEPKRRAFGM